MNNVNLSALFEDLQEELKGSLSVSRRHVTHPTLKGDGSELRWKETLQKYLPLRYQTERACVVDCMGQVSDQLDLVIFDRQYCPFLLNHNGLMYVPRESVYATFEVKQNLDANNYGDTVKKAESVRRLACSSTTIYDRGEARAPRASFQPLSGLLCLSGLESNLADWLTERDKASGRLDLGCCVEWGSWAWDPDGRRGGFDEPVEVLDTAAKDKALAFFMLRLLHRLQKLGTVPAINLKEYEKALT